jgi:uncharacterized protein YjiS (DUF1127 family)
MFVQVFGAIFRRWRERRQRTAAIRDLRALSDRTLKDMGLTRGEIVAAAHGQVYRGEPVRPPEPEPPPSSPAPEPARVEAIDAAAWRGHLDRARQQRAELIASLVRRGIGAMVRLLRRAVSGPLRRNPAPRPTSPPRPLRPSAGHQRAETMKENRHGRRSKHAA